MCSSNVPKTCGSNFSTVHCAADAAGCCESFLDFPVARPLATSEHDPDEHESERSEDVSVWSSDGADVSAMRSTLGLCSDEEVECCCSAVVSWPSLWSVVSWPSLWVSVCSPSSEQVGGLGLSDGVSCSAVLRSGELFVEDGDGVGEESAAPIEGLGADSARGESIGQEALCTDSVGESHDELGGMCRADEEGVPIGGAKRYRTTEQQWLWIYRTHINNRHASTLALSNTPCA